MVLIGDSELKVLAAEAPESARFELTRGKMRIAGAALPGPIAAMIGRDPIKLSIPAGAVAGIERINERTPGEKLPSPPGLRIYSAEGTVGVEAGAASETVPAGSSLLVHAPNEVSDKLAAATPPWLAEPEASAVDRERGKALARFFKAGLPPKIAMVEASTNERPEVKRDALTSLAAIASADPQSLELLIGALNAKDDPTSRKAAIAALREIAASDPEWSKRLRPTLEQFSSSKAAADTVERLLIGFTNHEAADEANQKQLVKDLTHEDVGIRELAIETLMKISRRANRLDYDPDQYNAAKPQDTPGVKNWQDLLSRKELRPPAAPKSKSGS